MDSYGGYTDVFCRVIVYQVVCTCICLFVWYLLANVCVLEFVYSCICVCMRKLVVMDL